MPAYLPDVARAVLPWAVNHTRRVARRYPLASLEDLWDETVTALLRASVHYRSDFPESDPQWRCHVDVQRVDDALQVAKSPPLL